MNRVVRLNSSNGTAMSCSEKNSLSMANTFPLAVRFISYCIFFGCYFFTGKTNSMRELNGSVA